MTDLLLTLAALSIWASLIVFGIGVVRAYQRGAV